MTIFRRKHMASFFSSLRRTAKKSSSSSQGMSSPLSQALPRQKKVYDFTAYFADQEIDNMSDDVIIGADDISLGGSDVVDDDDHHDEVVSSVIVEPDDTGSFVMTVVHRCHQQQQQHHHLHQQGEVTVQVQCSRDVCEASNVRQDCVQFCEQKMTALQVQH